MFDINPIGSVVNNLNQQNLSNIGSASLAPASAAGRKVVEKEFMEIFYKEILRQAFKPPQVGAQESSFPSPVNNEMLIDQLTHELIKNQEFLDIK